MPHAVLDTDPRTLRSFAEFYPFYLGEHRNPTCRRLHFAGSTLVLLSLGALAWTGQAGFVAAAFGCGYGFAWVGHFAFEKNRPASFKRPLYSFLGDWRMYADMWRGRVPL